MTTENGDLAAERDRLQAEVMRLRVERETTVPASLLGQATTEDEARAIAAAALQWRADRAAAPPTTAAVSASPYLVPGQIGRSTLAHLTPEQVSQVYKEGRLSQIGAPPPPPRRNGEPHRNAAP